MYKEKLNTNENYLPANKVIHINGIKYLFNLTFTVLELIDYLGFNKNVIVIDYNGSILEKRNWGQTTLQTKDALEILSIAGGG